MLRVKLFFLYLLFIIFLPIHYLYSQQLDTTMLMTDGQVDAIIKKENNIYIGGSFSYVGVNTGKGAILNIADGLLANKAIANVDGYNVDGNVNAVVPDQKGGWFIGGDFTKVQGIDRTYVAHILPNGKLDLSWNPVLTAFVNRKYEIVNSLLLVDSTLYIGGVPFALKGQSGPALGSLIALHSVTGQLIPTPFFTSYIHALHKTDNILYIGGYFTATIGGKTRSNIAALDLTNNQFTDFNPAVNSTVTKVISSKNTICIGGIFSTVNSQNCPYFAAIDATNSQLLKWSINLPNVAMDIADNILYLGGFIPNSTIGGKIRQSLASIDINTGQVTDWNPTTTLYEINTLKISKGRIYLGNRATSENRGYNFYAIDTTSNANQLWKARALQGQINTLAFWKDELYVGGTFKSIAGMERYGIACLDAYTGKLTPWQPLVNGSVRSIGIIGEDLYLGGGFTTVNGQARKYLASVSIATGETTNWNPTANNSVDKLTIVKNTIYVGGKFTTINGQARKYLGAIQAISGQVTEWSPSVNAFVNTLTYANNRIYIGGDFSQVNGESRKYLAAVDPISGVLKEWKPIANYPVRCITAFEDKMYIGGDFTSINGQERIYAASVNAFTGELTTWKPTLYTYTEGHGQVAAITVADNRMLVGGYFRTPAGTVSLSSVDIVTGKFTDWNPPLIASGTIKTITLADGVIYTGGTSFPSIVAYGKQLNPPNYIKGKIFNDKNKNCIINAGEDSLKNMLVIVQPGPYYGLTDEKGNYVIAVDTGTYIVKQVLPLDSDTKLIKQVCPKNNEGYTIDFKTYNNVAQNINFANEVTTCPLLSVEIASDRRRRCFKSTTTIDYFNEGLGSATDVKIHVKFPAFVVPVSANVMWTMGADSTYIFDIGNMSASQRGSISIIDSVICGIPSIRGLTQCTKVWITPANTCLLPDSQWDKSDISLQARCKDNGLVKMRIYNQGVGHMADSSSFRIYLDEDLVFTNSFKLVAGDSLILQVPVNGKTVRLEVDQRPYHPKSQFASLALEACGKDANGSVSMGFVTHLPIENGVPEEAIECLPIIDSYDPNDKGVVPQGTTANHYTPSGKALEYTIRFQNTGSDTAYKVVVIDTLSLNLDIATLRIESVSHPYQLSVTGKGKAVLNFNFDNINLPDSNHNEPKSHGYIKFSIKPNSTLSQGTKIENYADIFFDYNPSVRTNSVFNIIYDLPQEVPSNNPSKVVICQRNEISNAGPNRSICEADTIILSANSPFYGKGKWQVMKGNGKVKEVNNPHSLISQLSYGENILEWKVPANTCTTDSLASLVTITRFILPEVKSVRSDSVCGEGSVKLYAHGASLYRWYADLSATDPISTDSVFTTPTLEVPATYYVSAIESGCEGSRKAVQAVILPIPVTPAIRQKTADSLYSSTEATSYEWFLDGLPIDKHTQFISVNLPGKYTVQAITHTCTSALSEVFTYEKLPTGIVELSEVSINIYPNPTLGRFTLVMDLRNVALNRVSIFDALGRELMTKKLIATNAIVNEEIDLTSFGKGMYFMRIQTKQGILNKKIFVQ